MTDKIICGDCLEVMRGMEDGLYHCCVTSPPYWGLRDYGVEGQLGLEKTPEEYIAKMVEVFREVRRVLRDDGTLWLNMGDSYASSPTGSQGNYTGEKWGFGPNHKKKQADFQGTQGRNKIVSGLKPKDLCGIPWRVAFALQADGWYLRQDIIWHKPNPMPESVTDRCTKAHEYIFLMSKKPRYYYDAEAIKEEAATEPHAPGCKPRPITGPLVRQKADGSSASQWAEDSQERIWGSGCRNKRSVWTVATAPYKNAHFATFPPDLILPCILAGCPEQVCKKCGEPRRRITESEQIKRVRPNEYIKRTGAAGTGNFINQTVAGVRNTTTGWTDCGCNAGFDGGTVLDPFYGSGTTGMVAYENNRHYIGIELSKDYIGMDRAEKAKGKYTLFEGAGA